MIAEAVKPEFDPVADPAAVINVPDARFTLLTARMIRMEFSPTGVFEDRPSQAFWKRRLPIPNFTFENKDERLAIETEYLTLSYRPTPRGFTPSSLTVTVKATGATWHFGDTYRRSGNLGGTARTLDDAVGMVKLEPGLMARSGWALVDDSQSLVFNPDGWLTERAPRDNLDLYFFGYGRDYVACLQDFCRVAGQVPMIPRWALGNWWSRFWAYTADELLVLMDEFREHNVPLSVCIVDMDWHLTDTGGPATGWTGYTWNRSLFPDPQGFIRALHDRGLKTALNLHPAEGVWPHEEQFPAFAELMQADPQGADPIPFEAADLEFIRAYFRLLHHPFEDQGIDFWWMDWQQGTRSRLAGLDPLWWLNHLHFYDLGRDGRKRPFVFSRWGGLGNHRYPIGFSGDTVVGWEALDFQPYFTATAANVNYGWWSHDIGGHMFGIEDDELYLRWVQFGVFSPIFRLHSTNNPYHERRPWRRGMPAAAQAERMLRLRHALIPYIYSMTWRNHVDSLPLVLPMYYTHPEDAPAYQSSQQYWFGSQLIAAPFTRSAEESTRLARQTVWLPQGGWYDFWSGERFDSGWQTVFGSLEDVPVFAKAGAIVPLDAAYLDPKQAQPALSWANPAEMEIWIYAGADGRFDLYEDDGETSDYLSGEYAITRLALEWWPRSLRFTTPPARSEPAAKPFLPAERRYTLQIFGVERPEFLAVRLDGAEQSVDWSYDEENAILRLDPLQTRSGQELVIEIGVSSGELLARRDHSLRTLRKYLSAFALQSRVKQEIDNKWPEVSAGRIDLRNFGALSGEQANALRSILTREKNQ